MTYGCWQCWHSGLTARVASAATATDGVDEGLDHLKNAHNIIRQGSATVDPSVQVRKAQASRMYGQSQ